MAQSSCTALEWKSVTDIATTRQTYPPYSARRSSPKGRKGFLERTQPLALTWLDVVRLTRQRFLRKSCGRTVRNEYTPASRSCDYTVQCAWLEAARTYRIWLPSAMVLFGEVKQNSNRRESPRATSRNKETHQVRILSTGGRVLHDGRAHDTLGKQICPPSGK